MKKNKGFTLIELLAVIVILAIIALIAVPVVMNIIGKANKSAFKDSAYGLLKAGETYFTSELLKDAQGIAEDKVFTFPNNIEGLEFKGSKPSKGSMTVRKDGKVSMAISNGKYCVTKGFEDEDVVIKEDDGTCVLESYNLGDVVYYNPNEAKACTEAEWNNNIDKNGKTGCMRWYVYALNGSTPKLILDHNTTNMVEWISDEDYVDNGKCGMGDGWAATCNDQGSKTLDEQLEKDTKDQGWKVEADIITLEEVANLIPYYQNLSDSDKQLFLNPTEENTSVIDGYYEALDEAFYNMPSGDYDTVEIWKAQNEYLAENHSDIVLPKYMYEDILGTCENVGNEEDGYNVECVSWGYWIKTADALRSNYAWYVDCIGSVAGNGVDGLGGLRPVITLSK